MGVAPSAIIKPDLKEVVASVAAWVAALVVTLSNDVLRADQAMALAMVVPTLAWTVMNAHAFRHWFAPTPPRADDDEESSEERDEDDGPSRWGIHRRWLLGIVTPAVIVVLLGIGYELAELAGPDLRAPAPFVLLLVMGGLPWVLGLIAMIMLVAPGGLIVSGLRPDMRARRARIFGGVWAYVFVAFAAVAPQGAAAPRFGRPGWMREGLAILLGFNEEAVDSPGWMWAARALFAVALLVMPLIGALLMARSKPKRDPQEATST